MSTKTFLVTGGCGLLGEHLIRRLLEEFANIFIIVLDIVKTSKIPTSFHDPRVKVLVDKNICDFNAIENHFSGVDTVIHLAGLVSFSFKDRVLLKQINFDGTKNVARAANKHKVKNFIHISSCAALGYNNKSNNPINEEFKFNWKIAKSKHKYYMLTKHLADIFLIGHIKSNLLIFYPGLMLGPGDKTNSLKIIQATKKRKIPFNMPGGTNIIDVRDVSSGIVTAIKKEITRGNYLLSGYNIRFKDLNSIIAEKLFVQPPRFQLPNILHPIIFKLFLLTEMITKKSLALTADNVDSAFNFRYFRNDKAKQAFNWEPKITIKQTVQDTIEWMRQYELLER